MNKFRRYYLVWFIIFGIISTCGLLINLKHFDWKLLLFALTTAILIPLGIGRLLDWNENILTPKKRKKYYNKEPLVSLINYGFTNYNDEYFNGIFKSFYVEILYDQTLAGLLIFNFFYKPLSLEFEEIDRIHKLINPYKKDVYITPGFISFSKEINFRIPSIETILADLDSYCEILIENNLISITKLELNDLIKNHYNNK